MCKQIAGGLITGGNFQTLPKTSISRNASRENCSWKFSSRKWTCFTDRDCRCRRHHRRRWRRLLRRRCWCHLAKTSTKWIKPLPGWISSFCRKEKKITFQTFAAEWSFLFGNVSTCRCCCCCQCLWHLLVTIRKVGDVTVHDVAPNNFLKWLLMIQLYCNQF